MQTIKDVKIEMYEHMKDRYNDFLSEEERYIVENLKTPIYQDNEISFSYTEDVACDIVCQSLDGLCMTDTENACWEAGYIRGYEVALKEFKYALQTDYDTHAENINDAIEGLDYLLTN